jgi:anthranilate synthase component II
VTPRQARRQRAAAPARILIVDNYDSFTWNLVDYLRTLGTDVRVERNDAFSPAEALAMEADAYLISPGPGGPDGAGMSLGLVGACAEKRRPLLGVCLGHQSIAAWFGAKVVRAARAVHGKTCPVAHDGSGVFAGLPSPLTAARYHSLVVAPETLPSSLTINATADDATVQGIRHRELPIHGLQFHPESIASDFGHAILANFLAIAEASAKAAA